MTSTKTHRKLTSRRAVAPVIATLLLVAIAVVGGSIVFVFSQGFFSSAQVSGVPQIESLEIVGYDARDIEVLQIHDGNFTNSSPGATVVDGDANNGLLASERVAVYVQNQGSSTVSLTEVRFAGTEYTLDAGGLTTLDAFGASAIANGEFVIVTRSDPTGGLSTLAGDANPELQPGQAATLLMTLDENIREGRDAQIKITTANGAVFVGTVVAGQQSG